MAAPRLTGPYLRRLCPPPGCPPCGIIVSSTGYTVSIVSRFGLAVWRGKQRRLGLNPLRLSFLSLQKVKVTWCLTSTETIRLIVGTGGEGGEGGMDVGEEGDYTVPIATLSPPE